jgi:hypothetical protein
MDYGLLPPQPDATDVGVQRTLSTAFFELLIELVFERPSPALFDQVCARAAGMHTCVMISQNIPTLMVQYKNSVNDCEYLLFFFSFPPTLP